MSNTQTSYFGLNDAIERDRMANAPELLVVRKGDPELIERRQEQRYEPTPPRAWEPWLTIGIGVAVMMIAAFV